MKPRTFIITTGLAMVPVAVSAHSLGAAHGFAAGWVHPWSGWDHIVAMLAIGFWVARYGRRAHLTVPVGALLAMLAAVSFGLIGWSMMWATPGIFEFAAGFTASTLLLLGAGALLGTLAKRLVNRRHRLSGARDDRGLCR